MNQAKFKKKSREGVKKSGLWQWGRSAWIGGTIACVLAWVLMRHYKGKLPGTKLDEQLYKASKTNKPVTLKTLESIAFNAKTCGRVSFKSGGKFMRSLATRQEPVMIENSPSKDWGAFDLLELAKRKRDVTLSMAYIKGGVGSFTLGTERDRGGMIGSQKDYAIYHADTLLETFLEASFDNVSMLHRGSIEIWQRDFNMSFTDWKALGVNEKSIDNASPPAATIHLAHPGVTIQTTFRARHLVINQLQGFKTLLIFPSTDSEYLYPNIAHSFAYSQVRLEEDYNESSFPKLRGSGITAYVARLSPGDSVYVPPYWLVRDESVSLSLSLHVDSPSSIQTAFADAFSEQVPMGEMQSEQPLRGLAVLLLLRAVMKSAVGRGACFEFPPSTSLESFAAHIVSSRYAPYWRLVRARLPTEFDTSKCFSNRETNATVAEVFAKNENLWDTAAEKIVSHLCKAASAHAAIKMRVLMDYVEQTARWAVGPRQTGAFINSCLATQIL